MNKKIRRKNKKTPIKSNSFYLKLGLFVVTLVIISVVVYMLFPSKIKPDQKVVLFGKSNNYETQILIINLSQSSLAYLNIPSNTQVQAGYELGNWKMESVWKLADQESIGPNLVKNSLLKTFNFPVQYYSGVNLKKLSKGSLLSIFKFLISDTSDLNFKDELKLAFALSQIPNTSRSETYLEKTNALSETRLISGEDGYIVNNSIPITISKLFSQPVLFENNLQFRLQNHSGSYYAERLISDFTENLGSKVVSINTKDIKSDLDCSVISENQIVLTIISDYLKCETVNERPDGSIDVEINVGELFLKRF